MSKTIKRVRVWMPKCKASTFGDKRLKRLKTRQAQKREAIKDA